MGADDLRTVLPVAAAAQEDGHGCHSGKDAMHAAAQAAGKSEVLQPASLTDMLGREQIVKPTLEVIYDAA